MVSINKHYCNTLKNILVDKVDQESIVTKNLTFQGSSCRLSYLTNDEIF